MPGRLLLIAGLPGSGKSTYGNKLKSTIGATDYVDDYHRNAVNNNPAIDHGRAYHELVAGLRRGETWIASDIVWCQPAKRRALEAEFRRLVPDVVMEWHFPAVDEATCRDRVRKRQGRDVEAELRKIDELSPEYHVPPGSRIVQTSDSAALRDAV